MIKEKKTNIHNKRKKLLEVETTQTKTPLYIYFTNATKYYLQLLVVFQLDKMEK